MSSRFVIRAVCLIALIALSGLRTSVAQQLRSCDELLEEGSTAYVDRRYDEALQLADQCLARNELARDDMIASYRLLALAYIRLDQLGDARLAVLHLLDAAPEYQPDPITDPPDYTVLVDAVRNQFQQDLAETTRERSWMRANARWILSGGLAVAGGVLAAVLLQGQGSSGGSSSLPPPPGPPN